MVLRGTLAGQPGQHGIRVGGALIAAVGRIGKVGRQRLRHKGPDVPLVDGHAVGLDLVDAPIVGGARRQARDVIVHHHGHARANEVVRTQVGVRAQVHIVEAGPVPGGPLEQRDHDGHRAVRRVRVSGLLERGQDPVGQISDLAVREGPREDMNLIERPVERLIVVVAVLAETEGDVGTDGRVGLEPARALTDDVAVDVDFRVFSIAGADHMHPLVRGGRHITPDVQAGRIRAAPLDHPVGVPKLEDPPSLAVLEALAGDALPVAVGPVPSHPGRDGQLVVGGRVVGPAQHATGPLRLIVECDDPASDRIGDDRRTVDQRPMAIVA